MPFLTLIDADPERLAELPAGAYGRLECDGGMQGSAQPERHEAARTLRGRMGAT
jgi:hypothetical protein